MNSTDASDPSSDWNVQGWRTSPSRSSNFNVWQCFLLRYCLLLLDSVCFLSPCLLSVVPMPGGNLFPLSCVWKLLQIILPVVGCVWLPRPRMLTSHPPFILVCLFVCPSVCRIMRKLAGRCSLSLVEGWRMGAGAGGGTHLILVPIHLTLWKKPCLFFWLISDSLSAAFFFDVLPGQFLWNLVEGCSTAQEQTAANRLTDWQLESPPLHQGVPHIRLM